MTVISRVAFTVAILAHSLTATANAVDYPRIDEVCIADYECYDNFEVCSMKQTTTTAE